MNPPMHQSLVNFGLLVGALLAWVTPALAADYYVANSGSDANAGAISTPFQTLSKAASVAGPGDTIYVRGGSHTLTAGVKLTRSGNSGNYIRILAYPGELPVLDASAMTQTGYYSGWPLWLAGVSWIHIQGLEIHNGPMGGVVIDGASNNNLIEGLNVHHNGRLAQWEGKGICLFGSAANNLILNNDSHHNRDLQGSNADGFQISSSGGGNVLRGNRAWRNSDDGYDLFNIFDNTVNGTVLIENNWAFENGYDDALQPTGGDGNGFKLGGRRAGTTGTSGGHTLTGNLSWSNRADGFDENDASRSLTLFNNTAYNNGIYDYAFWTTPHILRNNLSLGSPSGILICCGAAGSITDHNSWTLPVTVTAADFASVDSGGATQSRSTDGSLPTSAFLRLVAGSDLIDQGVDVGLAFSGNAPDLGAYEFNAEPGTDVTAPTVPGGLVVSPVSASQLTLSWLSSIDDVAVAGYRVYRNSTWIADVTATLYNDFSLTQNTTYSYQVLARDAAGNQSALSASTSGKTWKFAVGSRVKTTGKITVRSGPGTNFASLGTQSKNARGTILGAPILTSGYYWWNGNFDSGADGWVREDTLNG